MTDVTSPGAVFPSRWSEGWSRVWTDPRRAGIARFLITTAQLGLALILLRAFETEPRSGLPRILPLIFVGFVVHAALPLKWRLPFFLGLSFAAIGLVLGPVAGAVLVLVGLALIGICHLRVGFSIRVMLLAIIAALLAALHAGWIGFPSAVSAAIGMPSLPRLVLPVLGSMFMFRLVIYLYDLRYDEQSRAATPPRSVSPASVWMRLSYFFLLPNVCFLLFPIVDFRTYLRTYYNREAPAIYQQGVWWICLGLVYLLGYRLVYHYLLPSPADVQGLGGVVRFMTSGYLIYFRVVGQFHLVVGFLCLFGFNLPPAHRYYLLASSFTDFWRRARIEWKDFMVKIFYYPVLVPLQRKLRSTTALVIATAVVFIATWLLHSYQWFWLRGDFRLSRSDGVFWAVIGGCVLINSVLEARSARARPASLRSFPRALLHAAQVLGMFVFMCVAWSYWSSPSLALWWSVVKAAGDSGPRDYLILLAVAGLVVVGGALVRLRTLGLPGAPRARVGSARGAVRQAPAALWWRPAAALAIAALVLLVRVPVIQAAIGDPIARVASMLSTDRLNAVDQNRQDRGYYEVLLDGAQSSAALMAAAGTEAATQPDSADTQLDAEGRTDLPTTSAVVADSVGDQGPPQSSGASATAPREAAEDRKPGSVASEAGEAGQRSSADAHAAAPAAGEAGRQPAADADTPSTRPAVRAVPLLERMLRGHNNRATGSALLWELLPNVNSTFRGIPFRTNQWGMPDKDYSLVRPPGTYRMALLGTSMTVSAGVPQDQTMEALLEDQLNRTGPGAPARKYEILNFSAGSYGIMQNVLVTEQKVFAFNPDAVLVGVFSVEIGRMQNYLVDVIKHGYRFQDSYVQNKLLQAGVDSTMEDPELLRRIGPITEDLVRWSYQRIVEICRQKNVRVIGIVLPEPEPRYGRDINTVVRLAAAAGLPLLDLRGVYDGLETRSLRLAGTDPHWSVAGNKLVSERTYQLLREHDAEMLKLGFSSRPSR